MVSSRLPTTLLLIAPSASHHPLSQLPCHFSIWCSAPCFAISTPSHHAYRSILRLAFQMRHLIIATTVNSKAIKREIKETLIQVGTYFDCFEVWFRKRQPLPAYGHPLVSILLGQHIKELHIPFHRGRPSFYNVVEDQSWLAYDSASRNVDNLFRKEFIRCVLFCLRPHFPSDGLYLRRALINTSGSERPGSCLGTSPPLGLLSFLCH
jgi:hypothetical protein